VEKDAKNSPQKRGSGTAR